MEAIQIISQDLFDKIRSRFQNLEMGDKTGTVTMDPAEARFFDFDFIRENSNLGRVSISLNDLGSLKIFYSQGITEDQDDIAKKMWFSFLKEMRQFAMRRLLRFDTRDISKTNLDKNDFQYLATKQSSKEEEPMTNTMNESRWVLEKSSKKTSRAVRGRTQVVVRHSESMAERRLGERSNPKKIKAIYIENSEGERFKYPFIHPAGAFAMAQHVDHGGIPHDPAGKAIIKMSEDIAQLQEFRRQVQRSTLNDDATGICERAVGRLNELKSRVEALSKRQHYESWVAEFNEQEHNDEILSELDPVQFEEYKSKFTQNSFNEELGKIFPLIHSIMQEKVDLEEYVEEGGETPLGSQLQQLTKSPDMVGAIEAAMGSGGPLGRYLKDQYNEIMINNGLKPDIDHEMILDKLANAIEGDFGDSNVDPQQPANDFAQFEQWAEAVEQGGLDLDAINDNLQGKSLTDELSTMSLGVDGVNAWSKLSGIFELDDSDQSDDAELKSRLAKAAQKAENVDATGLDSPAVTVFKNWVEERFPNWQEQLAELSPEVFGAPAAEPQAQPAAQVPAPAAPAPVAPEQPVAESKKSSMIEEIAKLVNSRFNRSNPNVGPFNGHEGILIDVEKTISEKFGEDAGKKARMIAEKYMEKLTMEWKQRHGDKLMGEKDNDMQRLHELVSKLTAKVEEKSKPQNERQPEMESILKLAGLKK